MPSRRDIFAGGGAAAAALLAMGGTAVLGLLLLDAGRVGRPDQLAAALVAMAAGAPVLVGATPSGGLPVTVSGQADVLPLGVTLAGMTLLGVLLARRGRAGLLLRGGTAVVVFTTGIGVAARMARGALTLPSALMPAPGTTSRCSSSRTGLFGALSGHTQADISAMSGWGGVTRTPISFGLPVAPGTSESFDAGFAVAVGPAVAGAAELALVVVALCWLALRFAPVAAGLRVLRRPALGLVVVCLAAAAVSGGPPAAGGLVLALPLGLALSPTVHADGVLSCAINGDGSFLMPHGASMVVLPVVALLGSCVLVAVAARRARPAGPVLRAAGVAAATGLALAALALVTQASAQVGVRALIFAVPVLDARLSTEPWTALLIGVVAGAAASLMTDAFVGWRPWRGHDAPR